MTTSDLEIQIEIVGYLMVMLFPTGTIRRIYETYTGPNNAYASSSSSFHEFPNPSSSNTSRIQMSPPPRTQGDQGE
jgi:hypothetical protein